METLVRGERGMLVCPAEVMDHLQGRYEFGEEGDEDPLVMRFHGHFHVYLVETKLSFFSKSLSPTGSSWC